MPPALEISSPLSEKPHLVFDRLARRLYMMARWFGVEITTDWIDLEQAWLSCTYQMTDQTDDTGNYLGGHKFRNRVSLNQEMSIQGDLALLWPLLVVGKRTNLGRGANIGLGKYSIVLDKQAE